jgi:hypothetical protein
VDDKQFNLRVPAEVKQPRRFEPPPWERDAFEKVQRQREAEKQEPLPAAVEQEAAASAEPLADPVVVDDGAQSQGSPPRKTASVSGEQIEERVLLEMLAGLAAEEPSSEPTYRKISHAASLLLVALGGVLIVWGMAALMSAGTTGMVGSLGGGVMLFFGSGFIGGAAWMTVKTLRQQGVL